MLIRKINSFLVIYADGRSIANIGLLFTGYAVDMGPATHQICNLAYALSAGVGGILVVMRGFDIGSLTVSLNYTRQFGRSINEILVQMRVVYAALTRAERVFEVFDQEPERQGECGSHEELLKMNGRYADLYHEKADLE